MTHDPQRRCDTHRHTYAEARITQAIHAVEGMAADQRLTAATILLGQARDRVADYVDGVEGQIDPFAPVISGERIGVLDQLLRERDARIAELTRDRDAAMANHKRVLDGLTKARIDAHALLDHIAELEAQLAEARRDAKIEHTAAQCEARQADKERETIKAMRGLSAEDKHQDRWHAYRAHVAGGIASHDGVMRRFKAADGAWMWQLDAKDIAIASEASANEAYGPLSGQAIVDDSPKCAAAVADALAKGVDAP